MATLEGWGGRYSCTFPVSQFTLFDYGRVKQPVRRRSATSDGEELGWFLCHPDDDLIAAVGGGDWVGPGLAHEYAYGRSARAGGVTITRIGRVVYSNKGVILPADQRAPIPGDFHHAAYGPGVLIGTTVWLVDTLWDRAYGEGHEAQLGYSTGTADDDDYRPAQRSRRPRLRRPAAEPFVPKSSPVASTRGRMGVGGTPGRRGRMGRS